MENFITLSEAKKQVREYLYGNDYEIAEFCWQDSKYEFGVNWTCCDLPIDYDECEHFTDEEWEELREYYYDVVDEFYDDVIVPYAAEMQKKQEEEEKKKMKEFLKEKGKEIRHDIKVHFKYIIEDYVESSELVNGKLWFWDSPNKDKYINYDLWVEMRHCPELKEYFEVYFKKFEKEKIIPKVKEKWLEIEARRKQA